MTTFREPVLTGDLKGPLKYVLAVAAVKRRQSREVEIALDDVALIMEDAFVRSIEANTRRYIELFHTAVDSLLATSGAPDTLRADDPLEDVLRHHRLMQVAEVEAAQGMEPKSKEELSRLFPAALLRAYELRILPRTTDKPLSLRQVAGSQLGRLVQVKAMTLRATDVKPLIQVATYSWCVRGRGDSCLACVALALPCRTPPHPPRTPPPSLQRRVRLRALPGDRGPHLYAVAALHVAAVRDESGAPSCPAQRAGAGSDPRPPPHTHPPPPSHPPTSTRLAGVCRCTRARASSSSTRSSRSRSCPKTCPWATSRAR